MCSTCLGIVSPVQFQSIIDEISCDNFDSAYVHIGQLRKDNANDPEVFVLMANYYFAKSEHHYVTVQPGTPREDTTLVLFNPASGAPVGYLADTSLYDPDTLRCGLSALSKGLQQYPDRLDMHFGLVYMTETAGLYGEMAEALLTILQRHEGNSGKWTWSFSNQLEEDPDQFVLENTQSRVYKLIQLNSPQADSLAELIAEEEIRCFPKSTYGYTSLGALRMVTNNLEASLQCFLTAFDINPRDGIVLSNFAVVYEKLGNMAEAALYYKRLIESGTPEEQEYARNRLAELRK
jgi:tetratricopeptide (TPR) repeat protein